MAESDAKRRAAARREAILGSKGNRLAKLTSSARGDEGAALSDTSPSLSARSSPVPPDVPRATTPNVPRPPAPTSSTSTPARTSAFIPPADTPPSLTGHDDASSAPLSSEQEALMMQAFMERLAPGFGSTNAQQQQHQPRTGQSIPAMPMGQAPADPLAAMMAQLMGGLPGGAANSPFGSLPPPQFGGLGPNMNPGAAMAPVATPPAPKTWVEKLLPLFHILAVFGLLGYFFRAYELGAIVNGPGSGWRSWASLITSKGDSTLAPAPIFYAFITLEIVLHTLRIFVEPPPQPRSGIIGMIVANLPPPLPGIIATSSKYVALIGAVLDDLSVLLFGVGMIIWYAGWTVR